MENTTPADDRNAPRPARRRFLREAAGVAGGAGLLALGVGLYARQASALPASALRPPGALPEADFLAACVRCGLCVRDCPYGTLKLAELGDGIATGTPYFNARSVPCEMCEDIPCVPACPTGALDRALTDIEQARMGLAVLIDQETCLNFLGLRCDVCYRVCPVIDKAITLEMSHNPRSDRHAMFLPTVHSDHCTGCGKCEQACVLPGEAAIKVLPIQLAKGSTAEHYRKGWVEREAHGRSLIGEQVELPVRGMEGQAYGDTRLRPDAAPQGAETAPYAPGGLDSGWKP
ncbi:ferredoxin-type protein NapG [Pseudothauera nasutitermitis]|uniref:Ferredoxin-type protein NapG n=1 Tax=Pseudothauera nasutitermitis TaxID=2565930 RepID=A0A4S4ARJ6_9RHOO|nr:ferredoxin-type protein NapG [Pseudothauera nasutitermitis]THF61109.1 ferredoxin-type protein NapG [Pseudothauera nasutitermitis]